MVDSTASALMGAIIGGLLSVLASWVSQRIQSKSQWFTQEIASRQLLYSEFLKAAVCFYTDALEHDEFDTTPLSTLSAELLRAGPAGSL